MNNADLWFPTLTRIAQIFAGGGLLVLLAGKGNWHKIRHGELGARYLGWLLIVPLPLLAILMGGVIGMMVWGGLTALALREYARAVNLHPHDRYMLLFTTLATALIVVLQPGWFAPLPVALMLFLTLIPILNGQPEALTRRAQPTFWGYLYIVWTLAHALLLYQLPDGAGWLIVAATGCAFADVGAYYIGKLLGKHPIAPRIHPQKAWEGLLGNVLGATLALSLFAWLLPLLSPLLCISVVLVIGIGSAWGDLLSSLLKRTLHIKDWGTLVPGHGGILDRLNSVIVVLPLLYYLLLAWGGTPSP
jgi:phosphatidate cytidylyltransferase